MKVALVHDYLVQDGGAERVLRVLQELYPEAPTFTLVYRADTMGRLFQGKDIRTSFLQKLPWGKTHYQWYLPLMPRATESFDLSSCDVVLSSSSAFAKGILTGPETLHLCYCHTPTRYLWTESAQYVQELRYPGFVKACIPPLLARLRVWDRLAADRVDAFVANSRNVASRITKYYRRESHVIYPPVEVQLFSLSSKPPQPYFLTGGRLVSYKRFDLVVRAFNALGIPLKIFGEGPEETHLKALAKPHITFLGKISDAERAGFYRNAQAFIHPQVEDFGITPVESMASGRPVIAYGKGGILETVIQGETGVMFEEQTWECLADTVIRFPEHQWDPLRIRAHAMQFSKERFMREMKTFVDQKWEEFNQNSRVASREWLILYGHRH